MTLSPDDRKAMRGQAEAILAYRSGVGGDSIVLESQRAQARRMIQVLDALDDAEAALLVDDPNLPEGTTWYDVYLAAARARDSNQDEISRLSAHLAGAVRLLERLEKECEEHDREYHHLTDKALLQSVRGFLSSTPADSLARVQAMEEALRKIQRWAAPDAHRTMDEMMRDLGMIDDEARTALERK